MRVFGKASQHARKGLLLAAVVPMLGACEVLDTGNPVSPTTRVARLEAAVSPHPIPRSGPSASCPARLPIAYGPFRITLREANGVDVDIRSWAWVDVATNGTRTLYDYTEFFARSFRLSSPRLAGNSSVELTTVSCLATTFRGASLELSFAGTDANGLLVEASASTPLAQ